MGTYLTYITGVTTLLGFILQVKDVFPEHREARKGILYICFGVFVGSVLGAINSVNIILDQGYGLISLILIGILVVIAFALIVMTFVAFNTTDLHQRSDLFNGIGFGVFIFFILLFAIALSTASLPAQSRYSTGEKMAMAKYNFEKKNYERAISLYRTSVIGLKASDPRKIKVSQIIEQAEKDMADDL